MNPVRRLLAVSSRNLRWLIVVVLSVAVTVSARAANQAVGLDPIAEGVSAPFARGACGTIVFNSDETYETGYAWQYGGNSPPDFGAFAESYSGVTSVCAVYLDLTQTGGQVDQPIDVYIWDQGNDRPGAVVAMAAGLDPGDVARWPAISRHSFSIDGTPSTNQWWAGFWGDWPSGIAAFFIAADVDGPGSDVEPMSKVPPDNEFGYGTGWRNVSDMWGPTQALGIGVEYSTGTIGACCYEDGTCRLRSINFCDGDYLGDDELCEPNPCPQPPSGACCSPNGDCELSNVFFCEESYLGDGTDCSPNPCPQPPIGACCHQGECFVLDVFDCDDLGGVWLGEVGCDGLECPEPECPGPQPMTGGENYTPSTRRGDPGPNAGGTLILHFNDDIELTGPGDGYCGTSELEFCGNAASTVNVDVPVVFHALAIFDPDAEPRLTGINFGVEYPGCVHISETGHCGDLAIETSDWPQSGEGAALAWVTPQTTSVTEVYWFVSYVDSGLSGTMNLIPHPQRGAYFADDSIPAILDPISALGAMGFGVAGFAPCPGATGACCNPEAECVLLSEPECLDIGGEYQGDGEPCIPETCLLARAGACCFDEDCMVTTFSECEGAGGLWLGDGVDCESDPCASTPIIETSWGKLKDRFRPLKR